VAVGLAFGQARPAGAASFTVNPVQVFLSGTTKSALISVKNETDQPLRFQLSLVAWNQAPDGQMQTAPTQDVVVFPPLLTLQAKEERKVRVGVTVAPGATERTYRLFVEELPPTDSQDAVNGVRMLTKMGIPIFLQPAKPTARAVLRDLTIKDGHLGFRLENQGTMHFVPQAVRVVGLDGGGLTLFEQKPNAWYVLAGGVRIFDVTVPQPSCAQLRSVVVDIQLNQSTLKESLQAPTGGCAK
jgi:fimbrial chaperone protein